MQSYIRSTALKNIINAKKHVINGEEYQNIPELLLKIAKRPALIELLQPDCLRMIHGDLHFQNILVGMSPAENDIPFILADPRGEIAGSDVYYDLGKLWHSFHGLYDFLHTDQFSVSIDFLDGSTVDAGLHMNNADILSTYKNIYKKMHALITQYPLIKNDTNWELRTLFSEAMHFSSVMPFHIKNDGYDKRAVALYLTGVRILNEFVELANLSRWSEQNCIYNINSLEDYHNMLKYYETIGLSL